VGAAALGACYLERLAARRCSTHTLRLTRTALRRFAAQLDGRRRRDLRRVDERDLARYLAQLRRAETRAGLGLSDWTVYNYCKVLKRFFGFLASAGLLLRDPSSGLELKAPQTLPRHVPSAAQLARLMQQPQQTAVGLRDRALLEVLYGSGLRISECSRLELGDLDLCRGLVFVRDGKGRKDRVVPLSGRAVTALLTYLRGSRRELLRTAHEAALFLSARGGGRMGVAELRVRVYWYARRAGFTSALGPHRLRHACATHLLQGGASVRHVQAILGHKCLATTALYTRVVMRDLAAVIARAHPRERARRYAR
jgi:integrase/recombinase XerD